MFVIKNGYLGYADKEGKEIIPCIYEEIGYDCLMEELKYSTIEDIEDWEYSIYFSEGMMLVKRENKWGYVGRNGKEVIPPAFEEAFDFNEGMAAVKQDGKWGYINCKGIFLIPAVYEKAEDFCNGRAMVKKNGRWGVIDKTGETILNFQYSQLNPIHCEDIENKMFELVENDKVGWIDIEGKQVVPCIYDSIIYYFNPGVFIVHKDKKIGCMNKNGEEIIPVIYDELFYCPEDNVFWTRKEYKVRFLKLDGEEIILEEKRRRWYKRM